MINPWHTEMEQQFECLVPPNPAKPWEKQPSLWGLTAHADSPYAGQQVQPMCFDTEGIKILFRMYLWPGNSKQCPSCGKVIDQDYSQTEDMWSSQSMFTLARCRTCVDRKEFSDKFWTFCKKTTTIWWIASLADAKALERDPNVMQLGPFGVSGDFHACLDNARLDQWQCYSTGGVVRHKGYAEYQSKNLLDALTPIEVYRMHAKRMGLNIVYNVNTQVDGSSNYDKGVPGVLLGVGTPSVDPAGGAPGAPGSYVSPPPGPLVHPLVRRQTPDLAAMGSQPRHRCRHQAQHWPRRWPVKQD